MKNEKNIYPHYYSRGDAHEKLNCESIAEVVQGLKSVLTEPANYSSWPY